MRALLIFIAALPGLADMGNVERQPLRATQS